MKTQKRVLSGKVIDLIAEYFKVLSEPLRIKILAALKDGEKNVNEIAQAVNSSQPNVSKHLAILVSSGLVTRRREKNTVFCSIADERIWKICDIECVR